MSERNTRLTDSAAFALLLLACVTAGNIPLMLALIAAAGVCLVVGGSGGGPRTN